GGGEEVAGDDALAEEAAIPVGEDREHGVDLAPTNERIEAPEIETPGHGADSNVSGRSVSSSRPPSGDFDRAATGRRWGRAESTTRVRSNRPSRGRADRW